jgi:hypothetical protein
LHGGGKQIPCRTRHGLLSLLDRVGQLSQRLNRRRILQLGGRLQRLLQLLFRPAHPGALDYLLPLEQGRDLVQPFIGQGQRQRGPPLRIHRDSQVNPLGQQLEAV